MGQQQRQQMVIQQNRRMKKYIQSQSRKNVLDGVSNKDDEKERVDTIDDDEDGDAAMILKDKKLAKVDDDGDTQIAQTPLSPAPKPDDHEMKETQTTTTTNNANSQRTKPQTIETKKKADKSSNKKSVKTPVVGPSVATLSSSDSSNKKPTNSTPNIANKRSSGLFGGLFHKKNRGKLGKNENNEVLPKRLKYQLPNSKGEKFELFTWLKPTKLLGEGAYAAVCEVIDQRTKKKYAIKKNRDVFSNVADARRILREIKLMIHFDHPH